MRANLGYVAGECTYTVRRDLAVILLGPRPVRPPPLPRAIVTPLGRLPRRCHVRAVCTRQRGLFLFPCRLFPPRRSPSVSLSLVILHLSRRLADFAFFLSPALAPSSSPPLSLCFSIFLSLRSRAHVLLYLRVTSRANVKRAMSKHEKNRRCTLCRDMCITFFFISQAPNDGIRGYATTKLRDART